MIDPGDSSGAAQNPPGGDTAADPGSRSVVTEFEASAADSADVDQELLPERLCRAVVDVLAVDGAAISVYLGGDIAVPVGASDTDATVGEALQFTVREGPCFESYTSRRPVLIGDLHDPASPAWSRWPTYAAQLTQHTAYHGVYAYPLLADGTAFGSLGLYRRAGGIPGSLNDVTVIAARVAAQLLAAELFTGPDGEPVHAWMDGGASSRRRHVWLAQGLILQANRITPGQAIDLLRAQAFTADRLLDDIAADIVTGRLPVPVLAC
jgi:GAF domain-containing protein